MAYANFRRNSGKNLTFVEVSQGAAGSTELKAAQAGLKQKIVSAVLSLDDTGSIQFSSSTLQTGAMPVSNTGGFVLPSGASHYWETAAGEALNLVTVTGKAFGTVGVVTEE